MNSDVESVPHQSGRKARNPSNEFKQSAIDFRICWPIWEVEVFALDDWKLQAGIPKYVIQTL
jgi:hypothetical protein